MHPRTSTASCAGESACAISSLARCCSGQCAKSDMGDRARLKACQGPILNSARGRALSGLWQCSLSLSLCCHKCHLLKAQKQADKGKGKENPQATEKSERR